MLCGASDVQPDECKLGSHQLRDRFPKMFEAVTSLFSRWAETGVDHAADLG